MGGAELAHLKYEVEAQDGGLDAGQGASASLSVLKCCLDTKCEWKNRPEGENLERSFEAARHDIVSGDRLCNVIMTTGAKCITILPDIKDGL